MMKKLIGLILVVTLITGGSYLLAFLTNNTFEESAIPVLIGCVAALTVRSGVNE